MSQRPSQIEPNELAIEALCALLGTPDYRPIMVPSVAWEIHQLVDRLETGFDDVRQCLEKDPMLAAQVLRKAQSPYYSTGVPISSLNNAIARLGLVHTRDVVWECAIRASMGGPLLEPINRHATETAYVARWLVETLHINAREAFLAGLLHDLGLLAVLTASRTEQGLEAQIQRIGVENFCEMHPRAGEKLAEVWNLPESVRTVIARHYTKPSDDDSALARVVRLADCLARRNGSSNPLEEPPYRDATTIEDFGPALNLTGEKLDAINDQAATLIARF